MSFLYYRLFPHLNLSVELTHTSNMRFMKFDSGIVETLLEDEDKDEEAWKRKSVKVRSWIRHILMTYSWPSYDVISSAKLIKLKFSRNQERPRLRRHISTTCSANHLRRAARLVQA